MKRAVDQSILDIMNLVEKLAAQHLKENQWWKWSSEYFCFRDAFSGYDAEIVAKFGEKKIASISACYGIDASQVRGVVDNSIRIMEVINWWNVKFSSSC